MPLDVELMTPNPQQFVRRRLILAYTLLMMGIGLAIAVYNLFPDFPSNLIWFWLMPFIIANPGKYFTHEVKSWYDQASKNGILGRLFCAWLSILLVLIYALPKFFDDFGVLYGLVGWALFPFFITATFFAAFDIAYILGRPIMDARLKEPARERNVPPKTVKRKSQSPNAWWAKYY